MKSVSTLVTILLFAIVLLFSPAKAQGDTLYAILQNETDYSTFFEHVNQFEDMVAQLKDVNSRLTVFAPTNQAFDDSPALPNGTALTNLMWYHFLGFARRTSDFKDLQLLQTLLELPTLNDTAQRSKVTIDGNEYFINDHEIVDPDVVGDNGVIHGINYVLFPPESIPEIIESSDHLSTFDSFLKETGVFSRLGARATTVLAPTDDSFKALPAPIFNYLKINQTSSINDLRYILTYHMLPAITYTEFLPYNVTTTVPSWLTDDDVTFRKPGDYPHSPVTVNEYSQITETDILASNGAIQEISQVLVPKGFNFNLYKLLQGLGLTKLIELLEQAEMTEFLNSTGPFTIFAPTNEAFNKFTPSSDQLKNYLQYHIVKNDQIFSNEFYTGKLINTTFIENSLNNLPQKVKITLSDNKRFVNNVTITEADQRASNGVVHVIDNVLIIPNLNIIDFISNYNNYSQFLNSIHKNSHSFIDIINSNHKTLLLPDNNAFNSMLPGYLPYLFDESNEGSKGDLYEVLSYHITTTSLIYIDELSLGENNFTTYANHLTAQVTINKISNVTNNIDNVIIDNNTKVVDPDVLVKNGAIQVIDHVLIPSNVRFTLEKLLRGLNLTMFTASLFTANEYGYVTSDGPITLFAPTNDAFKRIAHMEDLFENTETMRSVMSKHIFNGAIPSLESGKVYNTVGNEEIIVLSSHSVALKDSQSKVADVSQATYGVNGYIYVIDRVLGVESEDIDGSNRLNPGAIVGIVLGIVFGLALVIVCIASAIYFFHHRKQRGNYVEI